MDYEELIARNKNNFTYHQPDNLRIVKHQRIRESLNVVADMLVADCPESRELSLALTKLEEAMFWANAAIARN